MGKKILVFFILIQMIWIPFTAIAQNRGTVRRSRPPELRGSKEQRIKQNTKADSLGLVKITTRAELEMLASKGVLIELTDSNFYYIDPKPERICMLDAKKRYRAKSTKRRVFIYPAVKQYLDWLASNHFAEFHTRFKITSGARSLEEQASMRTRGSPCFTSYAAEAKSELEESLHVRGIAIDVSRKIMPASNKKKRKQKERQMSLREIAWMRDKLLEDKKTRDIEAEEKLPETLRELEVEPIEENICYHIVVFPR